MTGKTSFKIENNIFIVKLEGEVDRNRVIDTINSYSQLECYKPNLNRIWDFREATEIDLNAADLRYIKSYMGNNTALLHGYRIAYVSNRDIIFGLTRMFGFLADSLPIETMAFRDYDEALQWVSENVKINQNT